MVEPGWVMSEKRKYELHIYSAIENNYSLFDAKAAPIPPGGREFNHLQPVGEPTGLEERAEPKQGMEAEAGWLSGNRQARLLR